MHDNGVTDNGVYQEVRGTLTFASLTMTVYLRLPYGRGQGLRVRVEMPQNVPYHRLTVAFIPPSLSDGGILADGGWEVRCVGILTCSVRSRWWILNMNSRVSYVLFSTWDLIGSSAILLWL